MGLKQIIFSNEFLYNICPTCIYHSEAIPFYNKCGEVFGTQLILFKTDNVQEAKIINLLDKEKNNLY